MNENMFFPNENLKCQSVWAPEEGHKMKHLDRQKIKFLILVIKLKILNELLTVGSLGRQIRS